jgi:hypothetical protein
LRGAEISLPSGFSRWQAFREWGAPEMEAAAEVVIETAKSLELRHSAEKLGKWER